MSCAPNERLLQTLRVHVPGATDAMIELELFNVVDEFFRRTSSWLYTQDIELEENRLDYALALPADSTVVRLMWVSHQGVPVPSTASTAVVVSSLGRLSRNWGCRPARLRPCADGAQLCCV